MSSLIWKTVDQSEVDELIQSYTVGDDLQIDQMLMGYDIEATKAHASMLKSIGILSAAELSRMLSCLDKLKGLWEKDEVVIDPSTEDAHTYIELHLTKNLGQLGKKIHTGRSRNDQSLVMIRLYLKDVLQHIDWQVEAVIAALRSKQSKLGDLPMPGYTHMQKAMPTTVSNWLEGYAAALDDAKSQILSTLVILDQNPLGSVAGYGSAFKLDRQLTTDLLGFAKMQMNNEYCGLSRGLFEVYSLQALVPIMLLVGRFTRDLLLFSTSEFDYLHLPEHFTTGSSIMPHKKNYDVLEVMRGHSSSFMGSLNQVQQIYGGLNSGYQRDLQLTKKITVQAISTVELSLHLLPTIIKSMSFHDDQLKAAMSDELNSVSAIKDGMAEGLPFRDAYMKVKNEYKLK